MLQRDERRDTLIRSLGDDGGVDRCHADRGAHLRHSTLSQAAATDAAASVATAADFAARAAMGSRHVGVDLDPGVRPKTKWSKHPRMP
jgi:hypothetical protein